MVKTYVDSLRQTRQRLSALLSEAGDGDDPNGFVATYRTLVSELDDIVTFLEPCDHESEPRFIKAYESALEDTGDPNFDADIAEAIADLQREACEAITFLEGVGHIARNTDIFLKGQRENQNALLVSHNSLRDNLLQHKVEAEAALIDNASILDMLNHDIAISEDRIKRLNEVSHASRHHSEPLPSDHGDELPSHRSNVASRLISALQASPLTVIDEGDTRSRLHVSDSGSGAMSFMLDPMDPKAHAYLEEHLKGCKSRVQIAAVLQEALTLP